LPQLRDFLDRFRPAGAPGAARAGVPADRAGELASELEPVLAQLADTEAECRRIVADAEQEASRIAADARAQAAWLAADAQRRADAARDAAAERTLAAARAEADASARAAAEQASRPHNFAEWQVSELVAAAVGLVRSPPGASRQATGEGSGGP